MPIGTTVQLWIRLSVRLGTRYLEYAVLQLPVGFRLDPFWVTWHDLRVSTESYSDSGRWLTLCGEIDWLRQSNWADPLVTDSSISSLVEAVRALPDGPLG